MAEKCATAPIPETSAETAVPINTETPASAEVPTDPSTAVVAAAPPKDLETPAAITPEEAKRDREVIKARAEKLLKLLRA